MPTPKSQRTIVLQSSFSPTNQIASLNLEMDASFNSDASVATVNVTEDTSASDDESTEYSMTFSLVTGAPIGEITLSFTGAGDAPVTGVSVAKTTATTVTDPVASSGTVTPIAAPDAYFERIWQQPAREEKTDLVEQVGGLDVRVVASSGYTVTQTVTGTTDALLTLTYAWKNAAGAPLISGTVKLAASSVAHGDYSLGPVSVIDDPAQASREKPRRGRAGLRSRIKTLARELRKVRNKHDR